MYPINSNHMARIYDNLETKFTDGLQGIISNVGVKRVDFCVGYFNLRGWNLIVNEIDQLSGDFVYEQNNRIFRTCRLLIGMHRPDEDLVRSLYSGKKQLPDAEYVQKCRIAIARDFKKQLLLGLPSKNDEWTLRRLSAQMKEEKVCVRLYLREPLHAKLYLAYRPDDNFNPIQAIMGSSNLTYSGLTRQGELNAEFADSDSAEKLSEWFDARWNDKFCIDITSELIDAIDNSWAGEEDIPPYYIYLKTVYHLSQEARSGIKEFTLPPEFRNPLFDFQQNAVKIAAKHLNNDKRNGAMIGDVVGLGKTITACAIAKIYEMTYASSTLIICPANLQDMWAKYKQKYDLKADIVSMQKPIDVENTTSIVEHFSPVSNEKSYPADQQSRILIATDVLSEGQNLQDAHIIINYDLPWAIIRLIQRAGRVDRIGQQSDHIDCYSFFPADGVEQVIKLRKRLNDRINEAANVVGSDEVFFEGNEQNLRDMYNEKSGSLDDVDDNDVDLASQAYQIWKNATDAKPELKRIIPHLSNMINATKATTDRLNDGVITYAQTRSGFDVLSWYNSKGEIVSQSQKRILQAMECDADEPNVEPADQHYDLVKKAIDNIGDENPHVGGILGSRFSTRYKIIQRLERYYEKPVDLFFSDENKEELKYAINDIYNYPLQETAKFNLGRMMRQNNVSNDDLVEYVLDMRKNSQLCIIDEDTNSNKEPKIICSMGLRWRESHS